MASAKRPPTDPEDPVGSALGAAEEAAARFAEAKSEVVHRLADVDGAVVEMVQRVYDATPPEFQRSFHVSVDGDEPEELPLPEFIRLLLERPSGAAGEFTIAVQENLYDDGADEDDEESDED
ncbi:hypothetical protein [Longimicrobium terrae]|uniref:Uncharacterized protein n=1 Tax=Longimicrobium terrae TaxID=1639882 RepID=A0A841GUN6_9BACT|nr:hypothetical protein [Longimicrobium terrae]MBB4634753.1 hypothetical protein [Longimicrobium terrae]MBB6069148.1 hypothetical protein [Longimicrobium terrae]NNC32035.1 hypothetical protein [Longimicrobium terrae]